MGKLRNRWGGLLLLLLIVACQPRPDPTPTAQISAQPTATAVSPTAVPFTPTPAPTEAEPYPPPSTPIPTANMTAYPFDGEVYLPIISEEEETATLTASSTPLPSPTPTWTPTPIPTVDFTAVSNQLAAEGKELAFVKVGFHVGVGGNTDGLTQWMSALDEAGVPFFLKSVDNAQPILFAQQLMAQSGVPHTLVFRTTNRPDYEFDVPDYSLPPAEAARIHWQRSVEAFPPELDPSKVWLETINEVDKNEAEWLGQFALETAQLALRDGYNWAAFGWSSGEPEPFHWESPSMLAFLRLAAQHPERIAIALHEYSYVNENIQDEFPFKVGRFQTLFDVADRNGIPRPTVLITEWGWTYQSVPDVRTALADIAWASELYAPYPQIKGAAIWYLGNGFGGIANEAQRLIRPLTLYALTTYHAIDPGDAPVDPGPYDP